MRTSISEAKACDSIIGLIHGRCRMRLHEGREPLIRARPGKRMRMHGHESLEDYCHFLQNDAPAEEITEVVDALATSYTESLREPDHFEFGTGEFEGWFRIRPELAGRVQFEHLNLLEELSFTEPFDLIFCRNVMIYLDRATQEQLATSLARFLMGGGYLLTGHAESLTGLRVPFQCEQPGSYRKL
jgi:chemotaxis methyl-accepting protein methylase